MVKACNAMALHHYRQEGLFSLREEVIAISNGDNDTMQSFFLHCLHDSKCHRSLQQCSISALQHISPHNIKGPWYGYVTRLMQAGYVALFN